MKNKGYLDIEYLANSYNETNIPLYLSYPVESWWSSFATDEMLIEKYKNIVSPFLYFHFPYCPKVCYYCVCYKDIASDSSSNDVYIDYLVREFNNKLACFGSSGFKGINHMHWGGGTPTFLTCRQFDRLYNSILKKIDFCLDEKSSISIEAYPDEINLTKEKLRLIRDMGFNEISLGIQDIDERIQKVINRDCKAEFIGKTIELCKEQGFKLHIDLCYGLPFQGINELIRTLEFIITYDPDRIAIFPYAHYPLGFPMQKFIPYASLPNSFIKVLLLKTAEEILEASGYKKVGTDHFVMENNALYKAAVEGKITRDFMGYSVERRKNILGFGRSAISFLGDQFFQNSLLSKDYYQCIEKNVFPLERNKSHIFSEDDAIRNRVIQKYILSDFVIDKSKINDEFNIDFDNYFASELRCLAQYSKDGLISSTAQDTIQVTSVGKYFARHIAYAFDKYYYQ